jgi:hypothetical protein
VISTPTSGVQELSSFRRRFELWDRLQFFECGRKRVRETPDGPRIEFFAHGFEVQVVHRAGKVLGSFALPLHNAS